MKKYLASILYAFLFCCTSLYAESAFLVKQIEVEGLHRISAPTVISYLPIKRGQILTSRKSAESIRVLYQTGFFDHVSLARRDSTLIVHVIERRIIGQLKISGNSVIATDKLTTVMKSLEIVEGRTYNPVIIERIKQALLNQYYQLGRYNARIDVAATPMDSHRMLVRIVISEGLVAKVRRINIVGNHAFDEDELLKSVGEAVTTPGLFTFFTQKDRYSEEKLDKGLEQLRNYYLDRGYLRMRVTSAHAEITPDRKSVYITVTIEEGQVYTVKGYTLKGEFAVPREELEGLVAIKPGSVFSRKILVDSEKRISDYLGDKGYIFSTVNVLPQIDDAAHQVFLTLEVHAGKRVYVHHISFTDNARTNDEVLRREVLQLEAAPVSTTRIESSKRRLSLLPYIKDVQISVTPAPNTEDQVDVNYQVKEDNAAQATFSVGYSQQYKAMISAGLVQKNVLGTGNTLGINMTRSKVQQYYGMDYTDPYFTQDGISRSINFSISRFDPGEEDSVTGSYTTNEYNAGIAFGIPLGQELNVDNRLLLGASYQQTVVHLTSEQSAQVNAFVAQHGRLFRELDLKTGFSRDSRDKALFPTSGMLQTLYADLYLPVSSSSLTFYTLNYHNKWYYPLSNLFIATGRTDFGFGSTLQGARHFPFFKNYFGGGIDTVRGYEGGTLGPQDLNITTGKYHPFGGNMLVDSSIGLIFPNFISDNFRTTAFFDIGNIYNTWDNRSLGGTASGPLRYSAGVEGDMLTPLGSVGVSLAMPLKVLPGDRREIFQFTLGASLG